MKSVTSRGRIRPRYGFEMHFGRAVALLVLLAACSKSKTSSADALHAGDLLVQIALDPDPPRAGDNVLHVTVKDAQGKPVDGARVSLVYDMPAMGAMPEMKGNGQSKPMGGGKYDVSYSLLMLGDWYITLGIYSPDLLASEQDYLVAIHSQGVPGREQLVRAAEERLRLWGLSSEQMADLRKGGKAEPRITIHSPASGVVLEKNVVSGTRAMAGNVLYRIGNLGRIWVLADLFESDAPYVQGGQPATLSLPWAGRVTGNGGVQFVLPTVDEKTRAVRARLAFPNAQLSFKPGMFVDVNVQVPLGNRLAGPGNALLASGEHRDGFVKRGEGHLQATEVKVGAMAGDYH